MRLFAFACVRLRVLFAIDRVRVRACVRVHVRIIYIRFGHGITCVIIYTRVRVVRPFVFTNCVCVYHRSGFDCVVKRLRMALYKPDCDFNDCELPSG